MSRDTDVPPHSDLEHLHYPHSSKVCIVEKWFQIGNVVNMLCFKYLVYSFYIMYNYIRRYSLAWAMYCPPRSISTICLIYQNVIYAGSLKRAVLKITPTSGRYIDLYHSQPIEEKAYVVESQRTAC
jgi:hypothetical protein